MIWVYLPLWWRLIQLHSTLPAFTLAVAHYSHWEFRPSFCKLVRGEGSEGGVGCFVLFFFLIKECWIKNLCLHSVAFSITRYTRQWNFFSYLLTLLIFRLPFAKPMIWNLSRTAAWNVQYAEYLTFRVAQVCTSAFLKAA